MKRPDADWRWVSENHRPGRGVVHAWSQCRGPKFPMRELAHGDRPERRCFMCEWRESMNMPLT